MRWPWSSQEVAAARQEAEQAKRERLQAESRRLAAQRKADESMATVQKLRDHKYENGWTKTIFGVVGGPL